VYQNNKWLNRRSSYFVFCDDYLDLLSLFAWCFYIIVNARANGGIDYLMGHDTMVKLWWKNKVSP